MKVAVALALMSAGRAVMADDSGRIQFRVNAVNQGQKWTSDQLKSTNSNAGEKSKVTMKGIIHIDELSGLGEPDAKVSHPNSKKYMTAH